MPTWIAHALHQSERAHQDHIPRDESRHSLGPNNGFRDAAGGRPKSRSPLLTKRDRERNRDLQNPAVSAPPLVGFDCRAGNENQLMMTTAVIKIRTLSPLAPVNNVTKLP